MAWEQVGSGTFDDGTRYVIERRVVRIPVPRSTAWLSVPRQSHRWSLVAADGTRQVQSTVGSRSEIDAAIAAQARR